MKRIRLCAVGVVVLLAVVVVVRTVLHAPIPLEPVAAVEVELDEQAIAERLAASIAFKTISHQSPVFFEADEFEGFIDWLAATYPEAHAAMRKERLGDYTLLFT